MNSEPPANSTEAGPCWRCGTFLHAAEPSPRRDDYERARSTGWRVCGMCGAFMIIHPGAPAAEPTVAELVALQDSAELYGRMVTIEMELRSQMAQEIPDGWKAGL